MSLNSAHKTKRDTESQKKNPCWNSAAQILLCWVIHDNYWSSMKAAEKKNHHITHTDQKKEVKPITMTLQLPYCISSSISLSFFFNYCWLHTEVSLHWLSLEKYIYHSWKEVLTCKYSDWFLTVLLLPPVGGTVMMHSCVWEPFYFGVFCNFFFVICTDSFFSNKSFTEVVDANIITYWNMLKSPAVIDIHSASWRQCCTLQCCLCCRLLTPVFFSPQMSGTWYLGIPPSLDWACSLWCSTSSSWFSIIASIESRRTTKWFRNPPENTSVSVSEKDRDRERLKRRNIYIYVYEGERERGREGESERSPNPARDDSKYNWSILHTLQEFLMFLNFFFMVLTSYCFCSRKISCNVTFFKKFRNLYGRLFLLSPLYFFFLTTIPLP